MTPGMYQNAGNCGWFRGALSGLLSGACVYLPFAAYFWAPGLLFGLLVVIRAARLSGAGKIRTLLAFLTAFAAYPAAFLLQALAGMESQWNYILGCAVAGGGAAAVVTFWIYHWFENRGFLRWLRVSLVGALLGAIIGALMVFLPNDLTTWRIKVFVAFVLWQGAISAQYRFSRKRSSYSSAGFIQLRPTGVAILIAGVLVIAHRGGASAPKVKSSAPTNGAANVPATLEQITVEFDQPIQRGSLRFTGQSAWFPEITGDIEVDETGTRYSLPVQLEVNREYVIGLSGALNDSGELQEPVTMTFSTPFKDPAKQPAALDENRNKLSFFRLRGFVTENYSYRDRLGIDWNARFREFEPRMVASQTPRAFAHAAIELLSIAQDPHISVEVGGSRMPTWQAPFTANYSIPATREALISWSDHGPAVSTGVSGEGFGYLRIASLSPSRVIDFLRGMSAIPSLFQAPGLVIDLRENNGGSEYFAKAFAGMFTVAPVPYAQSVYRDGENPDRLLEPTVRILQPTPYAPHYSGPITTLIGNRIMSSAESLTLMLKQGVNERSFGATTRGSSGNPKNHPLGNEVSVNLPSWIALDALGAPLEGVGLEPDEPILTTSESFDTSDPVLDAALNWLTQP